MSRTSKALKRLGVSALCAVTVIGVAPALSAPAQANHTTTGITLTPEQDSAPTGTCNLFTATVTFNTTNAQQADTAVVDVLTQPRAGNQDVNFCEVNSTTNQSQNTTTGNVVTAGGAGQAENAEFIVTESSPNSGTGSVTFGIISQQTGIVDVTAFLENAGAATPTNNNTGQTATGNGQPDGTEPRDTSVKTFTAGGAGAATALDAEPESQVIVQGQTATFTARVTQQDGQPVPGVTPEFVVTSGPNQTAAGTTGTCTATNQNGVATCQLTANSGFGTNNITVFVDQDNDNVVDSTEPQDQITVTVQAPQQAGTTVELTCQAIRTNSAGDQCVNPLSERTETFTATVRNAAGQVVSGAAVQFSIAGQTNDNSANGGAGTTQNPDTEDVSPTSCQTDANGQCSTTLTNPVPTEGETVTVRATIITGPGSTQVSDTATKTWRTPAATEARNINLTPETQNAGIPGVAQVTATVTDRLGQPVGGVQVTFTESGAGRFVNGSSTFVAITDANGRAVAELQTVAGDQAGANTVTGTITGFQNGNNVTPRQNGTTDDECEQAATSTTSGQGNAPGQTAGNCSDTATVNFGTTTSPSPSPTNTNTGSPSPSPTTSAPTQKLSLTITGPGTITPGQQGILRASGQRNQAIELRCYSRPSTTYVTARQAELGEDGTVEFRITPGTNTRCFVRYLGAADNDPRNSGSVAQNVATALSLTVIRNGTRDYTFQGRILPRRAGQLITLYRVDNTGREVLTAQVRTDASGTWRIRRVFTGSGTFNFIARTGQNLTNVAGRSNVRPTAIF